MIPLLIGALALLATLFFVIPPKLRAGLLILISLGLLFALSGWFGAGLLVISILVNFLAGRALAGASGPPRKIIFFAALAANLAVLVSFRLDFVQSTDFFTSVGLTAAPIGISYYTLTQIAYLIDVEHGQTEPVPSLIAYANIVGFFPMLLAGPIESVRHLAPQFGEGRPFAEVRIVRGLRRTLRGWIKKFVIADLLSVYVTQVYAHPADFPGLPLIAATVLFSFQIYADFSGYTDMALGFGQILGIELFENFRQPFFAQSILEFWRRWHMSLTNWLRAYVFLPLTRQLLRTTQLRYQRAIEVGAYFVIMLLVGMWHGITWTFVCWGLLHAVYMSVEVMLVRRTQPRSPGRISAGSILRAGVVFGLVTFAWIFFRSETLAEAGFIITHLFAASGDVLAPFAASGLNGAFFLALYPCLIVLLLVFELVDERLHDLLDGMPAALRWGVYYLMLSSVLLITVTQPPSGFLYSQF